MADQFSYPLTFQQGPDSLKDHCLDILGKIGFDSAIVSYFSINKWFRVHVGIKFPETSLENLLYRLVIQENGFAQITDVLNHPSYKFIALKSGAPLIRFIAAVPIFNYSKVVTGAITVIDGRRREIAEKEIIMLEEFSSSISRDLQAEKSQLI